jgi:DNA-binding Lrp family transcriptional regulator
MEGLMTETIAYVLIQTSSARAILAAREIAAIAGVEAADAVTGPYDIICRVRAGDLEELAGTVVDQIQSVAGVERTETALILQSRDT